jgi:hypothetical protein
MNLAQTFHHPPDALVISSVDGRVMATNVDVFIDC